MNKVLLYIFVGVLVCSCQPGTTQHNRLGFSNDQQYAFDSIHNEQGLACMKSPNDIKEKESFENYKTKISQFMDSIYLMHNWQGKISNIKSEKTGTNSTALSFDIKFVSPKYEMNYMTGNREYTLSVDYVVNNDSIASDSVYQKISNMSNFTDVYFDGFLREKADGSPYIVDEYLNKGLLLDNPQYKFFIVDIYTESKGDTLSSNLKDAVELSFKAIEPLKLNFRKEITKKESERRVDAIAPKLKAAKEKLTKEELAYIWRLTEALTANFLYAD